MLNPETTKRVMDEYHNHARPVGKIVEDNKFSDFDVIASLCKFAMKRMRSYFIYQIFFAIYCY